MFQSPKSHCDKFRTPWKTLFSQSFFTQLVMSTYTHPHPNTQPATRTLCLFKFYSCRWRKIRFFLKVTWNILRYCSDKCHAGTRQYISYFTILCNIQHKFKTSQKTRIPQLCYADKCNFNYIQSQDQHMILKAVFF